METELLNPAIKLTEGVILDSDLLATARDMLSGMDFHIFKYLIDLLEEKSEIAPPPATFVLYGPPRSGKSFLLNKLRDYLGDGEEKVAWATDWCSSFSDDCFTRQKLPNGCTEYKCHPLKDLPRDKIAIIHLTARDGELKKLLNQSVGRDVHVINFT
jgi:Ni2+-binding GTPase involved in maturation of urease and hydrogenase